MKIEITLIHRYMMYSNTMVMFFFILAIFLYTAAKNYKCKFVSKARFPLDQFVRANGKFNNVIGCMAKKRTFSHYWILVSPPFAREQIRPVENRLKLYFVRF